MITCHLKLVNLMQEQKHASLSAPLRITRLCSLNLIFPVSKAQKLHEAIKDIIKLQN